ncbi:hypothetical protein EZV62_003900 [Acer yangbiense]|uniref:SWIM-type domain-containing protein n=1 Tax=Acer yangbiense TaxID=1000413 RepID=A0A5C7IIQ4_9ROSI|nr:hypothetical protein EZV62_003900 [Acer yangbiense]
MTKDKFFPPMIQNGAVNLEKREGGVRVWGSSSADSTSLSDYGGASSDSEATKEELIQATIVAEMKARSKAGFVSSEIEAGEIPSNGNSVLREEMVRTTVEVEKNRASMDLVDSEEATLAAEEELRQSSKGIGKDPTKLVITYGGKWVGNFYEGGETEFLKVHRNLSYDELLKVVQGVANVDLRRFTIELRTLVDTGVRFRPAQPKIKDDSDVKMLLCDDQHVPEVYVSAVEKVSAERGHVGVPIVQPIYQTFSQQLAAQFPSGGGSNNVWGSIPTTNPSFDQTMNPIIVEDQTIDEVVEEPYNENDRSIPEYNPHSEYGLDDFNEDYIGDGGSREGVNDEAAHHHGMDSNPTDGGGCTGFVPPVFAGPSRDTFEDDGVNVANMSENSFPRPWIIPGASNHYFELARTEESSSCNRLSKGGMFKSKICLKRALQCYAVKEDFEIHVTRSSMTRYEAGCKDPECKFQLRAVKMEGGNYWIVRIFERDHSCTIDGLHNRYRQASAWLIGEMLSPKLAVNGRSLKPKEIMTDMQVEYGLRLNYTKAWKAKEHAENNVFGPPDMSYQLLPAYCHELKRVNPDNVNFNVKDGEKDGLVNLSEKTCTCKEFQNDLLPCSHALAAIRFCKKKFVDFCSDFYKTNTWLESYSGLIFPIGHPTEWNTPAEVRSEVVLPPEWQAQAGRPRKIRIPSTGKHGSKTRYCTICKKSGHNRQNCPNPPADQQVNVPRPTNSSTTTSSTS